MDQVLAFGIIEKGRTLKENRLQMIIVAKKGGRGEPFLFSGYLEDNKLQAGTSKRINNFEGSLRFTRISSRVTSYSREAGRKNWTKLSTLPSRQSDAKVGFTVNNFFRNRTSIKATRTIHGWFDNFVINAARAIDEGEI